MKAKSRHKSIFMYHPAGPEYEEVRTFPPVVVPSKRSEEGALFVYVEADYGSSWRRKRVNPRSDYPGCFIAWDADEGEWAMHQPGCLSVEEEYEPQDLPQPNQPSMDLLHPEVRGIFEPKSNHKRKRRSLREWFLSLSDSNEVPDFLRHEDSS